MARPRVECSSVARHHERGAHAPVELAAGALPVALLRRPRKTALDPEVELRANLRVHGRGAEPQVIGERRRLDDLSRIEQPLWVPQRLQLAEGARQLRAEHPLREHPPHDAVAVLAAERAPEFEHQVRDLLGQPLRLR